VKIFYDIKDLLINNTCFRSGGESQKNTQVTNHLYKKAEWNCRHTKGVRQKNYETHTIAFIMKTHVPWFVVKYKMCTIKKTY